MKYLHIALTASIAASLSMTASAEFSKEFRALAAKDSGIEFGYLNVGGSKKPYVVRNGAVTTEAQILKEAADKRKAEAAAAEMLKQEAEAAKQMMATPVGKAKSEAYGSNTSKQYAFGKKFSLTLVKLSNGEAAVIGKTSLTGENGAFLHSEDAFGEYKRTPLQATFDLDASSGNEFSVNINHHGLFLNKAKKGVLNYTQSMYGAPQNTSKDTTTLMMQVGKSIEMFDNDGTRYLFKLSAK